MLILFLITDLFYGFVLIKKRIHINDTFVYVFWGFMNLYTLCIYISHITGMYIRYPIPQLKNRSIISAVLLTSSIAMITFGVCLMLSSKIIEKEKNVEIRNLKLVEVMYWFFFPVAFYYNTISNWTLGDRTGLDAHLSAYSRNILTVLCVIIFSQRKKKIWQKLIYLGLFVMITFRSTQRTNMLVVLIAFVYTIRSIRKILYALLSGVAALVALGAIRNGHSFIDFKYSIMAEGLFGSWGLLQAIETTGNQGYTWGSFFKLFGATCNWLLSHFGIYEVFPTLESIITKTGAIYYPMGGFFYLSDAYLMHPYFGPVIYTFLIFGLYRWSLCGYYYNHSPLYLMCLSVLFVSIKGALWTFTAFLLFHILFCIVISFVLNPHIKVRWKGKPIGIRK